MHSALFIRGVLEYIRVQIIVSLEEMMLSILDSIC